MGDGDEEVTRCNCNHALYHTTECSLQILLAGVFALLRYINCSSSHRSESFREISGKIIFFFYTNCGGNDVSDSYILASLLIFLIDLFLLSLLLSLS